MNDQPLVPWGACHACTSWRPLGLLGLCAPCLDLFETFEVEHELWMLAEGGEVR